MSPRINASALNFSLEYLSNMNLLATFASQALAWPPQWLYLRRRPLFILSPREGYQRCDDHETLCSEVYVCSEVVLEDTDSMVTSNTTLSDFLVPCSSRTETSSHR